MDPTIFSEGIFQLGGTVTTTALFIWYIQNRNGKHDRANERHVSALDAMSKNIERQTRVLISIAKTHELDGDADDLLRS